MVGVFSATNLCSLPMDCFVRYDKQENNTGSLCARLSGDAAKVQGATGARVGSITQVGTEYR